MVVVKIWILLGFCFSFTFCHNCEVDSDCVDGKVCRMICKRTCSAVCVGITELKQKFSKEHKFFSSEEPFAVDSNPFENLQRDEAAAAAATPLTISEAELEAELKQSFGTTPMAQLEFETGTTSFPIPPTSLPEFPATTILIKASSPGQSPHPPGIEHHHESGYMPPASEDPLTTVSPATTNFIEPTSGGGGYDRGVDEFSHIEENLDTTLAVSEATMFTESTSPTPLLEISTLSFETIAPITEASTTSDSFALEETTTESATSESINNSTADGLLNNGVEESSTGLQNAVVQGIPFENPNECPPPPICGKNCGVFVDEKGCQTCQCLWLPISCEDSADCIEEGQFCDLGRCECMPGYIQDMLQSGICKPLTNEVDLQNIAEIHSSNSSTAASPPSSNNQYPQLRIKRSQTSEKPHRMERLQWPGPCDSDSQCPSSLFCIQGDCWHLPEKPLRGNSRHQISNSEDDDDDDEIHVPKSFPLQSDEDEAESSTTTPLPFDVPLFAFKAFPRPPPSTARPFSSKHRGNKLEEARPPSLRPVDYDETSFLGEFGDTFVVPTTEAAPITRMINMAPTFIRSKKIKSKKFRNTSQRSDPPPHLEEILHSSPATPSLKFKSSNRLSFPKYRNPKVAAEGWQAMEPRKVTAKFQLPTTTPMDEMAKVFLDYSNRQKHPVRVEMNGAKHVMKDECSSDRQCGEKYVCCEKRWCDLSRECGRANFCLPNCEATKMTHLSSTGIIGMPLIDLVYD